MRGQSLDLLGLGLRQLLDSLERLARRVLTYQLAGHSYLDGGNGITHNCAMRDAAERFWEKVNKTETCWLWTANKNNMGYGLFRPGGLASKRLAHRISYEMENGPIPEGMCALHRCDTPACVNPAHIFLGTKKDNVADMDAKGRRVIGWNPNNKPPIYKGSKNPQAKLTEEKVLEIRARLASGAFVRALAREFRVDRKTLMRIRDRESWKHI